MGLIVLLDTHVLLWALMEPEHLSARARQVIEDPDTVLWVSSASAWEISTKQRLGHLPHAAPVVHGFAGHLRALRALELRVSGEHALLAGQLPAQHRDPFDRMLAAQALVEGVPLLTTDAAFSAFSVATLW